jgi:uncharacterized protein
MRCPMCGEPLEGMPSRRVEIEACPGCGGRWLDKGEWEGLVGIVNLTKKAYRIGKILDDFYI